MNSYVYNECIKKLKMEKNSTYHVDLISRYFAGEATSDEMQALSLWLKSNTENQKIFIEYQKTWNIVEQSKINSAIDINEEWSKIIFFVGAGTKQKEIHKEAQLEPIYHARPNLLLRFSRIAAVFVIVAVSAAVLYFLLRPGEPKTVSLFANTGIIEKRLPDGTSVTLNSGSIYYPEKFTGKKRTVTLKGEAYFNVIHDNTRPFVITAGDVMVEVLGTSFYVNTDTINGNVEVILTTGKVAVYNKNTPNDRIILNPGEKADFSKTEQKIAKSENDDENYMAFKSKILVFSDTPLNEIVESLKKVYHTNIRIKDNKLATCRVTSTFDNKSLDAVLNVLKATIDVNIVKSGSIVEISGNGCK